MQWAGRRNERDRKRKYTPLSILPIIYHLFRPELTHESNDIGMLSIVVSKEQFFSQKSTGQSGFYNSVGIYCYNGAFTGCRLQLQDKR